MKKFICLLPIFILCVCFLLTGCTNKRDIMIVQVASSSMAESGINGGDYVVIKKVNISQIEENDIILYYNSTLKSNTDANKELLSETKLENTKDFKSGGKTYEKSLILHQVIGVYYDNEGYTWYETKGTSNINADAVLTRADYVVGKFEKVYKRGSQNGNVVFQQLNSNNV